MRIRSALVPAVVAGILTSVYALTLAPDVTLWDSGEFLAAIHSLGIPHPPGTPLYIVIGAVWARATEALLDFARAINLLSALSTALGCAVLGAAIARWTSSRITGVAAGLAAGAMLSVWRNATETEVYALSFALALLALVLGDRAGITGRWRDAVLAIYVLALAVPLHLSSLVIAPGVVAFAAMDNDRHVDWSKALALGGGALLVMALGTVSLALGVAGLAMLLGGLTRKLPRRIQLRDAAAVAAVVALGVSSVFVMYFRARHDPFVNQGNPATLEALIGVVGREQYDVPPLWPRRTPLWIQIGNVIQYADWQIAFGLDEWVGPSVRRTPWTLLFGVLAIAGAAWHRARDRRSFRAVALALSSASLGAIFVLNLRAGPSFGFGVLPVNALHEARERDYFFAIAFALAGAWAAMGATRVGLWLASRFRHERLAPITALALAGLPVALNWRAADRSSNAATLAQQFGASLLDSSPKNAVLLVAGDNDTYPLWYLQRVHGRRPDVTVVTIPLLPAEWYRDELRSRHGIAIDGWRGLEASITAVASSAAEHERPLSVANSVAARQRMALGNLWLLRGMVYERRGDRAAAPDGAISVRMQADTLAIDSTAASTLVDTQALLRLARPRTARLLSDPTVTYTDAMLACPSSILAAIRARGGSVDPRCNLR